MEYMHLTVAYIQGTGHPGPDTGADFWQVTMGWLLQLEPHFQIWRIFTISMMIKIRLSQNMTSPMDTALDLGMVWDGKLWVGSGIEHQYGANDDDDICNTDDEDSI